MPSSPTAWVSNADGNPRKEYLHFIIGSGETALCVTVDPAKRGRDDPPYVESFEYKKRTRNFSAGEWTLVLVDPTFLLLDRISATFNSQAFPDPVSSSSSSVLDYSSAPLGSVSFEFGYTLSSGFTVRSPLIRGYILKIKPSVFRWGMRLTVTGLDFNLVANAMAIPGATLVTFMETQASTATLSGFITAMLAGQRQVTQFAFQPSDLADLSMANLPLFLGDGLVSGAVEPTDDASATTTENYSSLSQYITQDGIAIRDLLRLVQDYTTSEGRQSYVRLDGLRNTGTEEAPMEALLYTVVESGCGLSASGAVPTFWINTEKMMDADGNEVDNFSNVESFDVEIDPIAIGILAVSDDAQYVRDPYTRDVVSVEAPMSEFSGSVEGDSVATVGALTTPQGASDDPKEARAGVQAKMALSPPASPVTQPMGGFTPDSVRQAMSRRQAVFSKWPFQGSMTVAYPDPNLNPWESIQVYVITPQQSLFMTSGRYLVKDISYRIQLGRFSGTYSLLKSGSKSLPGGLEALPAAYHPDVPPFDGTPTLP
jgi:hypothetical protein